MRRLGRRSLILVAVACAVLVGATGAFAWISSAGGGEGSAVGGSLTAPVAQGTTAPTGAPSIVWTPAQVRPDDRAADAVITYRVDRSTDGGATWTLAAGTCAGTLTSSTLACDDDPPVGSYEYRVTASYRSWSSTATTGVVSTRNITSLGLAAPAAATTEVALPASAVAATLSGSTSAPAAGGTIIVSYFGPQAVPPATCQTSGAGWTELGDATVNGDGSYTPAAGFTPSAPGTYWWYASYGGDTLNFGTAATCGAGEASTVVTNATTTGLTAPASGTVGTAIPLSGVVAALSGATSSPLAGGTVTFSYFGPQDAPPLFCDESGAGWTAAGTAPVSGSGSYKLGGAFTPTAPGTYWWFASYGGDTLDGTSTSECDAGMASTGVSKAQPTLTVAVGGAPAAGTAGTAIDPATITASLTGRVMPDSSGTISFFSVEQPDAPTACSGGTQLGSPVAETPTADYHPSDPFTPATAGTYWLYAVYSGDLDNLDASGACPPAAAQEIQVAPAQPSVTLSVDGGPATLPIGSSFPAGSIDATLAGRVSQDGTGTVEFFYVDSNDPPAACGTGIEVGLPVTESDADTYNPTVDFTPTSPGNYWLYAAYSGDANNYAASGSCPPAAAQEIQVTAAQPTLTLAVNGAPATVAAGTPFAATSITATLDGRQGEDGTGSVSFYYVLQPAAPTGCSGGTLVGTAIAESAATTYNPSGAFTPTTPGTYWLYAVYSGDSTNDGTSGTCPPGAAQELQVAVAP